MNTASNIFIENLNRYLNDNPDMNIPAMCRAGGPPTNCVYLDETTGHVLISENGGPLKKANPFVVAMATGKKYRGPDKLNPLPSKKICFEPNQEARSTTRWLRTCLISCLKKLMLCKDTFVHPSYQCVRDRYIELLYSESAREVLSSGMTNCERWDCIIEHITDRLDVLSSSPAGR